MNRIVQLSCLVVAAFFALCLPAMAQEGSAVDFSPSFGAGVIILGAGLGIGKIGAAAVESTARQPESAGDIRQGMILAAALIEGVTLLALIICLIAVFR